MKDSRHLRMQGEGESKGLLQGETQPEDAQILLEKMKKISKLISEVTTLI